LIPYLALIASGCGNALKQFAMKNCGRRAPGAFNSICINLARAVICAVVSIVFWLASGLGTTNGLGYFSAIMAGIANAVGLFCWIIASGFIPMSLIEIFSAFGNLVVPMLLAPLLFNGDSVGILQWVGCILLVASVFTFLNPADIKGKSDGKKGSGMLFKVVIVALQTVSAGAVTVFQKYYNFHVLSHGNGTMEYFNLISFFVMIVAFLLAFLFFYIFKRESITEGGGRVELPYKSVWIFILMAGIGLYIAQYGSGIASELPSAVYFPLSKSAIMIETFILDTVVFKDKFSFRRVIGLIMVIIATVLVNL